MINYIEGSWNWEQTLELIARDTRHYAKRQYTWFNNDPEIKWYEVNDTDAIFKEIETFLTPQKP